MKRILCFGDSLTWGSRPDNYERFSEELRWTKRLARELGPEYEVIEEGHNGRTTVWSDPAEGKMSGMDYMLPCLESHAPLDVVVFMLGTNDCKERYNVNAYTIAFGMGRMIETARFTLKRVGCRAKILLIAPPCIGPVYKEHPVMYGFFGENACEKSKAIPEAYREIASQFDCAFFDANGVAQTSGIDGVHLDAENNARLATALANKIRETIES